MGRYRRLVLMDRIIPFLSAFVGLVALGGALLVQANTNARSQFVLDEIAVVRAEIQAVAGQSVAPVADPAEAERIEGLIDAMLALQSRMDTLETAWEERPEPVAAVDSGTAGFTSADGQAMVDPDWPTENCIPIGTRFMASVGDELPICQSPVVIVVNAVTDDNVLVEGTGLITETAFKTIPGSNCRLTVFSADAAGFTEMRVGC